LTEAERGFLMLLDEETGELDFKVARNMDRETLAGSSFEISRTIINRVAVEGEPILTTNAQDDPRFSNHASVVGYSLRSILCVPLKVKDKVTGVIYADNRIRAGLFRERDRDLLAAFADQAAMAIENARLFESIVIAKNLMDDVFASIASGVITTDVMDKVTLINRAAASILGVPAEQAIGAPYRDVLSALEESLQPLIEEVKLKQQEFIAYEIEPELPQRGAVSLSMNLSPLKDAQEGTLGVAIVIDDLTEKKRFEQLKELTEFLSTLSHELRTPLTPVQSCIENLLSGMYGPLTDKQQDRLEIALIGTREEARLIENLLDLVRFQEDRVMLERELSSIAKVIRDVTSVFEFEANRKKIALNAELPDEDPLEILMDTGKVKQVLTNLVDNALKFTPVGGTVTVGVSSPDHEIEIWVRDTGIGIKKEELEKIFDRFYRVDSSLTREVSGTGIGLSIAKEYVEMHGGRVWVESEADKGSTFFFTLPKDSPGKD